MNENENEMVMAVDWTKQNTEMNEHDKAFCDELYRELRLKKQKELEGASTEQISQEVQNV